MTSRNPALREVMRRSIAKTTSEEGTKHPGPDCIEVVYSVGNASKRDLLDTFMESRPLPHALMSRVYKNGVQETGAVCAAVSNDWNLLTRIARLLSPTRPIGVQDVSPDSNPGKLWSGFTYYTGDKVPTNRSFAEATIEKSKPKYQPPTMVEERVGFHIKSIAGRLLTIVDAMFGNNQIQCDALKTIFKKEFRTQLHRVCKELNNKNGNGQSESAEDKAARELEI